MKTEWIWDFGLISSCDQGVPDSPISYFESESEFNPNLYSNVQENDLVWVQSRFLSDFYYKVLPNIENKFILVISDGDESFPDDVHTSFDIEEFIGDSRIIHVFAQNCDYSGRSGKVSHIPIGMDFHTIGYKSANGGWGERATPKNQEQRLKKILATLKPTKKRRLKAFVDFQHSDTMHGGFNRYLQFGEDRASIFEYLKSTGLIDYNGFMKRSNLWKMKGNYAFSISPHGNGLDCHRTWEDLVLGCIVIVKTSPLDPLYEGLPVVIVKDWSEVTEENFKVWIEEYGDAFNNPQYREKLTNRYWLNKIKEKIEINSLTKSNL